MVEISIFLMKKVSNSQNLTAYLDYTAFSDYKYVYSLQIYIPSKSSRMGFTASYNFVVRQRKNH